MKFNQKLLGVLACASVLAGVVVSCGEERASSTVYKGPGSHWEAQLTGETSGDFTFTKYAALSSTSADMIVNGTFETLSVGFLKFTVTSSSSPSGAATSSLPPNGGVAYGLNIPGFALLIQPSSSNSEIIPMIAGGACPTANMNMNWVTVQGSQTSDNATADFFGSASFTTASSAMSLTGKYALTSGFPTVSGGGTLSASTSCNDGVLTVNMGSETATLYLNAQGGAIVDTGNGPIVAMPQASVAASALSGDYVGFAFTQTGSGSSETAAFSGSFNSSGVFIGGKILNETTVSTSEKAKITLSDFNAKSTNGLVTGTMYVTSSDGSFGTGAADSDIGASLRRSVSQNIACSAATNVVSSGKNFVFCVAQGFEGNGTTLTNGKPFSMLFVSK